MFIGADKPLPLVGQEAEFKFESTLKFCQSVVSARHLAITAEGYSRRPFQVCYSRCWQHPACLRNEIQWALSLLWYWLSSSLRDCESQKGFNFLWILGSDESLTSSVWRQEIFSSEIIISMDFARICYRTNFNKPALIALLNLSINHWSEQWGKNVLSTRIMRTVAHIARGFEPHVVFDAVSCLTSIFGQGNSSRWSTFIPVILPPGVKTSIEFRGSTSVYTGTPLGGSSCDCVPYEFVADRKWTHCSWRPQNNGSITSHRRFSPPIYQIKTLFKSSCHGTDHIENNLQSQERYDFWPFIVLLLRVSTYYETLPVN